MEHAKAAIAMLTTAHELYKKGSQRAHRLLYQIGAMLAREHLASDDVGSASKLLQSVAGLRNCITYHCTAPDENPMGSDCNITPAKTDCCMRVVQVQAKGSWCRRMWAVAC